MSRVTETVLVVIGLVINILMIVVGAILASISHNADFLHEMESELTTNPDLASLNVDPSQITDLISSVGWGFVVVVVISTILAIVSFPALRRNRKPKLAGWVLIISGLLVGLATLLIGWLPGLLFLIAGILCFTRKGSPPQTL